MPSVKARDARGQRCVCPSTSRRIGFSELARRSRNLADRDRGRDARPGKGGVDENCSLEYGSPVMPEKFAGTIEQLKDHVANTRIGGKWSESNGAQQFKSNDGGTLNWWPSSGTLQFQGKQAAKQALETAVMGELKRPSAKATVGRQIFVVHGHDQAARNDLELFLRRLGLDPFILMRTSGGGKTIIDALEGKIGRDHTSDFGIAMFTPDDSATSSRGGQVVQEKRARQNVVLETGMLLASLTRDRMAILVKGDVELPSDLQGVIQLRFKTSVQEIAADLCDRLRQSGVPIDPATMVSALK